MRNLVILTKLSCTFRAESCDDVVGVMTYEAFGEGDGWHTLLGETDGAATLGAAEMGVTVVFAIDVV